MISHFCHRPLKSKYCSFELRIQNITDQLAECSIFHTVASKYKTNIFVSNNLNYINVLEIFYCDANLIHLHVQCYSLDFI